MDAGVKLTQRDCYLDHALFCQLLSPALHVFGSRRAVDLGLHLPVPAILKPRRLYTGKQFFTALLEMLVQHHAPALFAANCSNARTGALSFRFGVQSQRSVKGEHTVPAALMNTASFQLLSGPFPWTSEPFLEARLPAAPTVARCTTRGPNKMFDLCKGQSVAGSGHHRRAEQPTSLPETALRRPGGQAVACQSPHPNEESEPPPPPETATPFPHAIMMT